jgi:hypothetical protein
MMNKQQEQLETLREIRSYMERSSRFLSLSGLSGVIIGIAAITGIVAAYLYLGLSPGEPGYYNFAIGENGEPVHSFYTFMFVDVIIVLSISLLAAGLLTMRKARRKGTPAWDSAAKRLMGNLVIPLVTGGLYCLALLYHGQIAFIAPATLIFYGLALVNASKYAIDDLRYLGTGQIITGLIASAVPDYGLLFWAFGFGILHIVYGVLMYIKYEK